MKPFKIAREITSGLADLGVSSTMALVLMNGVSTIPGGKVGLIIYGVGAAITSGILADLASAKVNKDFDFIEENVKESLK